MIVKKRNNLIKILLCFVLICSGIVSLLFLMKDYLVFFYTPSEVLSMQNNLPSQFRVGGVVESSHFTEKGGEISFYILDDTNNQSRIQVKFKGDIPFMFREKQSVVIEGGMRDDVFEASRILIKHDENYYPKE